jgi:hypothetical protein
MKPNRKILLTLAFLSLLVLSGCVNLVQEMRVNPDGSGALRFALGVESEVYPEVQMAIPEGFELENLLSTLIRDENVTDVVQEEYQEGGRTYQSITLEVADFLLVFGEEGRRIGPLTVSLTREDDVYRFEQVIDLENSNLRIPGINLLDLSGAGYTVRLLVPQITDTNGRQDAAGESVWEVPLSELLQGGETIRLEAEYVLEPYEGFFIPWEKLFPYIVIGFVGLGFLAVLVVIVVNTVGKRKEKRRYRF